ncbi:MAG: hypothetical protein WC223_12615 [Bacteroidales bacterium]|jgi:hypothetical protein
MKTILFILIIFIITLKVFSQDLIVNKKGDSLKCKIIKIEKEYIYFTYYYKNSIKDTNLATAQVKEFISDYYTKPEASSYKNANKKNKIIRIAASGGYSYRVARLSPDIPNDFVDYMKKLRNGYAFSSDIIFHDSKSFWAGFKYSYAKFINEMDNIYIIYPNNSIRYGKLRDDVTINYIAPSMNFLLFSKNKMTKYILGMSIGYLNYKDNALLIDRYLIKGETVGVTFDYGFDFCLSGSYDLGLLFSFNIASLGVYKISDGTTVRKVQLEKGKYENLSRIDLTIGLRFLK